MREIKFRAWQSHNSLHREPGMYEVKDIVWYERPFVESDEVDDERIYTGEVFFKGHDSSEYLEDVALMQYTGLRDKNGVEIYEGDVVEMTNPNYVVPAGPYSDMVVRCGDRREVRSLESGFTLTHINSSTKHIPNIAGHVDNYNFWNMHRCFEVIGNIYENPELLK